MSYLTFNDLSYQSFDKASSVNELSRSSTEKQVFLSYRRKDKNYVKPVVNILKRLGVNIYIDYNLLDKPNEVTAAISKVYINGNSK